MKTSSAARASSSWIVCAAMTTLSFTACGSDSGDAATTVPFTTTAADGGEAPTDRCLGDAFDDDFVLQTDDGVSLSGDAEVLASSDAGVVACGAGFLEVVDGGSVTLDGTCSSLAVAGDVAIVGMRGGDVVAVDLAGPALGGSVSVGAAVHGVATDGTTVWAAAGDAGVVAVPLAGGSLGSATPIGSIADARGVAIDDAGLWVAAGDDGVTVLDPTTGAARGAAETASDALGVRTTAAGTVVLLGVGGWERYEASGTTLQKVGSEGTTGAALDAVEHDGELVTAEIHTLVRHTSAGPRFEERPGFGSLDAPWLGAIVSHDGELLAAVGDELVPVEVAPRTAVPDVMIDATTVYMWGDPGERLESLVVVDNLGDAPLVVGDVEIDAPFEFAFQDGGDPVEGCDDTVSIPAGGSLLLAVSYTPDDDALVTGEITLRTNDPDEPELVLTVDGNRGAPTIGSEAADFELLTIYGERFRLSDHRGKVVLVKLFNFGCKVCAEEFATIQNELIPGYAASEFVAVGVNTTHRTGFAGSVVEEGGLTLPMTLDIDSTAFRHYRMPRKVFPLNVVVGRDGKIEHVDTEEGLAPTEAAVAAAM